MKLRDAMQSAGLSYRPFATALKISDTSISRLLNWGEYPARIGEDEVRQRMTAVFEAAGVRGEDVEWPQAGVRPGCNGYWRKKGGERVRQHRPRKLKPAEALPPEEIDLMQLDKNVLSLFRLRANPFLNDVEADEDVFRFRGYELVEAALREAIEQRGFLAVVGESGSGKTTVWDGIEAEYGQREDTVICRPLVKARETLTPEHLARCLIYGLLGNGVTVRVNAEDRGRQLSMALRSIRSETNDKKAVLLIDDAHFCNASVLRQLKTFFEEKIGRYRLLSIVLIGLLDLKTKLSLFPEVGNRVRLVEMSPAPVKEYLGFKLRRVGSSIEQLFDAGGLQAFCERFRQARKAEMGRPLLINAACIRAMVALQQNGGQAGERITREIVDQLPGDSARRAA